MGADVKSSALYGGNYGIIFINLDVFQTMAKTLVNIAYGLNQSKELKDLFLDLVERFIEPCRATGWNLTDVRTFLNAYAEASMQADIISKYVGMVETLCFLDFHLLIKNRKLKSPV